MRCRTALNHLGVIIAPQARLFDFCSQHVALDHAPSIFPISPATDVLSKIQRHHATHHILELQLMCVSEILVSAS